MSDLQKPKPEPLKVFTSKQMKGKKVQDVFLQVYDVRETVFTNQTGQFPHHSQSGYKYIMVMVEIDSSAILVAPIKNRTDAELTRAYESLMQRLHQAGIQQKNTSLIMKSLQL
jgi:hypothetical protein